MLKQANNHWILLMQTPMALNVCFPVSKQYGIWPYIWLYPALLVAQNHKHQTKASFTGNPK